MGNSAQNNSKPCPGLSFPNRVLRHQGGARKLQKSQDGDSLSVCQLGQPFSHCSKPASILFCLCLTLFILSFFSYLYSFFFSLSLSLSVFLSFCPSFSILLPPFLHNFFLNLHRSLLVFFRCLLALATLSFLYFLFICLKPLAWLLLHQFSHRCSSQSFLITFLSLNPPFFSIYFSDSSTFSSFHNPYNIYQLS